MLNFIDISSYQKTLKLSDVKSSIDGVFVKATEGTTYVNPYCDTHYTQAKNCGLLRGFYHFAKSGKAYTEAEYFYNNCKGYFRDGIPMLDWEGEQSVSWVNEFVRHLKDISGVWCWIYANPWRFNQGGVESNCARWVASYPNYSHPTFAQAAKWDWPSADGNIVAWQFCSDGRLSGYSSNLDCNLYCGDESSWKKYAGVSSTEQTSSGATQNTTSNTVTLENDEYKVTIEKR